MAYRKKGKFGFGMHNIKVRVQRAMDMDALNIMVWLQRGDGRHMVAKPMRLEFEPYKEGTCVSEPTLQLTGELAGDLLDALTEELGNIGVKTQNDHKVEGLLEAQTAHLKDMRQLVFKGEDDDKET